MGIHVNAVIYVDGFESLIRKHDVVRWPRIDEQLTVAVKYRAAGSRDRY